MVGLFLKFITTFLKLRYGWRKTITKWLFFSSIGIKKNAGSLEVTVSDASFRVSRNDLPLEDIVEFMNTKALEQTFHMRLHFDIVGKEKM